MKIVITGASGLIGHGFAYESIHAPDVSEVLTIGRTPSGIEHPKLRHVHQADFADFTTLADELADADALFWALGVAANTVSPAEYDRITYQYTAAAAHTLARVNPTATMVYVSGGGTDSTERGRSRWARVKGRTENMVISTFPDGYALRPGFVRPTHGRQSRTRSYRWMLAAATPLFPLLRVTTLSAVLVTDTRQIGLAALNLARHGWNTPVLENRDIIAIARL